MRIRVLDIFLSICMFCSRKKQIRLLSINTDFCQIISLMDSNFLFLVDLGNPSWIRGLLPRTNGLISVPSREYPVCFLLAFMTSGSSIKKFHISTIISQNQFFILLYIFVTNYELLGWTIGWTNGLGYWANSSSAYGH